MALYYGTTISGGNVQLGDTHHTHYHTHHVTKDTADAGTVFAWLSNLNFGATLTLHCNKRVPATGTWLTEDPRYKSWRICNGLPGRVLWCRGNPGSGKPILCSTVIEHLRNNIQTGEAVVYCFFDYARRQELTTDAVLAELLVQLATKNMSQLLPLVWSLYEEAENGRRKPTLRELTIAFQKAFSTFERVFIVVDALDESDHSIRRQLLQALNLVDNSNISLLIFGRPHVQLSTYLGKALIQISEIEIQAQASDLQLFIGTRIADNEDLDCIIENCEITIQGITNQIIEKAGFSFLAAEMRMNALQFAITAEDLARALQSVLTDPTDLYAETLTRIRSQHQQKAQLALSVLAWLSLVKRPLTIRELCNALGLQLCKQDFSRNQVPAPDIVLSSCFGLVIQDRHNDRVRLLHYTLLEYLEQHNLLEFRHQTVLETCLKCLSVPDIEKLSFRVSQRSSRVAAIQMQIVRALPFCEYAATHWFTHMSLEFETLDCLITYLKSSDKLVAWFRLFDFHDPKHYRRIFRSPIFGHDPCTDSCQGIRTAVAMGWRESLPLLIARNESDKSEVDAMLAATLSHRASDFLEMLLVHGLDPCYKDSDGNSLLHQAVSVNFSAGVQLLAKYGADLNQRNSKQQTPLQIGLSLCDEDSCQTLVRCGTATNTSDSSGSSLLHTAIKSHASESLVRTMMSHGSPSDARNISGETPLHLALRLLQPGGLQESVVRALLEYGSPVDASTMNGYNALHYACIWSCGYIVLKMILDKYADMLQRGLKNKDFVNTFPTPLHASFTPAECGELLSILELSSRHADFRASSEGRLLSVHYAASVSCIVLKSVLRVQTPVDCVNSDGGSPLHGAVMNNREDSAGLLLQAGVDVNHKDCEGNTALHLAARAGMAGFVIFLLQNGAAVATHNSKGLSALHLAILEGLSQERARAELLYQTCRIFGNLDNSSESIQELLENGSDVDDRDNEGRTALHLALEIDVPLSNAKGILARTKSINAKNNQGDTALHIALVRTLKGEGSKYDGHSPEVVRLLLGSGADIDARGHDRRTPLHIMAEHIGFISHDVHAVASLLNVLLRYRPCLKALDVLGRTPLDAICVSRCSHELREYIKCRFTGDVPRSEDYFHQVVRAENTSLLDYDSDDLWD